MMVIRGVVWILVLRATAAARYLSSLRELDELRQGTINNMYYHNVTVTRAGNVDVIHFDQEEEIKPIAYCRWDYTMGHSMFVKRPNGLQARIPLKSAVEGAAAVALAAQHLNTGNGSIIPEVEGLNERCNVRFTFQTSDNMHSQVQAVDQIVEKTTINNPIKELPCAFMGDLMSRTTMSSAMITGLRGYLQMGYATATELENRDLFPLATRIVPPLTGGATLVIRYLYEKLNVRHLVSLHTDTRESQSYSVALQQAAANHAPLLKLVSIDVPDDLTPEALEQAIQKMKDTGYTFFFGAVKKDHFEALWTEAVKQGIAGTGLHNWIYPGGTAFFSGKVLEASSPQALAGLGMIGINLDGSLPHPIYDKFYQAYEELGTSPEDVEYLKSKLPVYPNATRNIFTPILKDPDFLKRPSAGVETWIYDSAIAVGLAACNAAAPETYFDGPAHFQALKGVAFGGASGNVSFDPITGSRQNAQYKVTNVQRDEEASNGTHVAFKVVTTSVVMDGKFEDLEPVMFNDGTTTIPLDLPPFTLEENYLSTGLRAAGLAMCGTVVLLAVLASGWVQFHRNARVVLSAQPIFLHVLCVGVAILGLSIIPLSFDEQATATIHGCNVACQSFPFLLSVGFSLTFSALWAKTSRVNKIIHNPRFRRMSVSAFDVARPMLVVLCANILVLSLWTALSPLQCETEIVALDVFERVIETRGYCTSESSSLGYLIALGFINLSPLIFAVYESYVARHISTEFAETDYILKALVVLVSVSFIGMPVLVIAHDNSSAYFFVLSGIIFIICMAILLLIFVPKILAHYEVDLVGNDKVPHKFSRRKEKSSALSGKSSSGFDESGRYSYTSGMNNSTASDDNNSSLVGLKIMSHPKNNEALQRENEKLRLQNKKLKKALASLEPSKVGESESKQSVVSWQSMGSEETQDELEIETTSDENKDKEVGIERCPEEPTATEQQQQQQDGTRQT